MKEKRKTREVFLGIAHQWNRRNFRLLLWYLLLALGVNTVVELCNRRSFSALFSYIVEKPLQYVCGILIIYLTITACLLFRKRNYLLMIVCAAWVGLSVVSFVMLSGFRSTPLTAPDIAILKSVRDIIQIYMNNFEVTLILIGIALLAGLIVFMAFRFKTHKAPYAFALVNIGLIALMLWGSSYALRSGGYLATQFTNIPDAYQENGFVYCFTCSAIYQGIDKPEDYSEERINGITEQLDAVKPETETKKPNIIFVQLESFFDVKYLNGVTYSEDPIPNFTALKKECSTGLFSVPSIGAGTVNTEFEVLSQMNLQHFGMGEYPYKTVVRYRVCDSVAYALRNLDYSCHAIHDNNATFYSRNRVYRNFGFDTFTSVEYMNNVELNPLAWAKDTCLTGEIMDTMNSTEGNDFVFTVSVQAHGQYPSEVVDDTQSIYLTSGLENDKRKTGFEYYINQLHETDEFVGNLIAALKDYDEDTIVVFYGDHLPSFELTNEDLNKGNMQTTEYVIWANFDIPKVDKDIYAYQLSSTVLGKLGITEGILTKYHMLHEKEDPDSDTYQDDLKELEYDMLYGNSFCYGGTCPFQATEMQLGTKIIRIENAVYNEAEDAIYLVGRNFTPYSVAMVDEEQYNTEFISPYLLRVTGLRAASGDEIVVGQVSKTDALRVLSETEPYVYQNKAENAAP